MPAATSVRFLGVHHHGYACADIAAAFTLVSSLGEVVSDSGIIHDSLQDADLRMITYADGSRIELVSGAMVAGVLKRGPGVYHTCFEVSDLDGAINELRRSGAMPISAAKPAILFGGRRVVFLMSKLGIIELLEAECPT